MTPVMRYNHKATPYASLSTRGVRVKLLLSQAFLDMCRCHLSRNPRQFSAFVPEFMTLQPIFAQDIFGTPGFLPAVHALISWELGVGSPFTEVALFNHSGRCRLPP